MTDATVPRAFEWPPVLIYVALAAGSAAVCADINLHLGVTPNTAVIGVMVAIALGRTMLPPFRSAQRQVMVETATSAGGFAGANIALVGLAVLYLLRLERLALPLLAGVTAGMVLDIWLASRLFGTRAFPAEGAWPDGEAVGRVIEAGDRGGRLARELLQGLLFGAVGRLASLPMAGVGIAFIGNPAALGALAVGLIARGHGALIGLDLGASRLPHGLMIGAGLVQVVQTARLFWRTRRTAGTGPPTESDETTERPSRELALHAGLFIVTAAGLAAAGGLWTGMSAVRLGGWIAFAGIAALVHTIIVGYCAMLSGWFPSFAVAIALILVAVLIGFPVEALALLAGFILSTGPQFADLGYDLKSGWIVRGRGTDPKGELAGRHQQVRLQQLGAVVGIVTVALAFGSFWRLGLVPPMSRVVATTVTLALSPALGRELVIGGLFGAVIQLAGGSQRAIGILLATGLLLDNPLYGWALAVSLVLRRWIGTAAMGIRAPGLIAGDGLAGFISAIARRF